MRRIILFIFLLLSLPIHVYAHPGRTDENGCHVCNTNCDNYGLEYGEYHCHDGNSKNKNPKPEEDNLSLLESFILCTFFIVPAYKGYNLYKTKKHNDEMNYFTKSHIYKLQGKKNPYTKKYMNTFYQCRMYVEEYYDRHGKYPEL